MSTVKELREEQARIATNARAKFEEIKADTKEDRAAEIEREFDAMMAEHDKLDAKADRLEKLAKAERAINEPDPRRPVVKVEGRGVDEGEPVSYRNAFHDYLRAAGKIGDMAPESRAVLQAGWNAVENRAQTSGTTTEGGFTVPTELQNILIKSMLAWGPMYDENICTTITTVGGGQILMPTVNDTAKVVVKHVEGTTLTDDGGSDVVFGQKALDAYPFNTEFIRVSKELVDDSIFAMEQILGTLLGERLGRRANLELTTGDGTGDPNGIVTASSVGDTTASATALTADELIDHMHTVDPAYRVGPKVRWMFNDATLAYIRKLKDGNGNYLWQIGDYRDGIAGTILGYPYSVNQAMASIASTAKPVVFGDFGKYYVRKVGGVLIGALQDKDFWPGFGIAGYIRFDGELADTAAVKHLLCAT